MSDDGTGSAPAGTLTPGGAWTETAFETGTYGPDDRTGLAATLERDAMRVRAVPVRFERRDNRETVTPLVESEVESYERRGPGTVADAVSRRTAFATLVAYRPGEQVRRDVVSVARDAGDALAAAVWLARASDTDWQMERNLRHHRGERTAATDVTVADDDALGALFREAPDRCVVTGRPTRSHTLALPYRYFPALRGAKRTPRGVPRIPSTVVELVGAVSHDAWTDAPFADLDLAAPLERAGPGEYRLDADVLDAVAGLAAADFALRRPGDEEA